MVSILFCLYYLQDMHCMFLSMGNYQVSSSDVCRKKNKNTNHQKISLPGFFFFFLMYFCLLLVGSAYGRMENPKLTFNGNVKLRAGNNKISLLSIAVGLPVSPIFLSLSVCYCISSRSNSNKLFVVIEFRMWGRILRHGMLEFLVQ